MKSLVVFLAVVLLLGACGDADQDVAETAPPDTVPAATTSNPEPESATTTPAPVTTTSAVESESREVTFVSGDLEMVGTLRVPEETPAPAVLLVHGSGPNSRDEVAIGQLNLGFGFEVPVFAEIGDALQEAGFVVLTYDKRTCGPFNGCADNGYPLPDEGMLVDIFMADAQAAVEFLRGLPEVDPDRVAVVGHSQGAEFVPVMLDADPRLAQGAMLACPFRPIDELSEFQYTSSVELLQSLGMSEEQAMATPGVANLLTLVDGLERIRAGSSEGVGGVSAEFWTSWFDLGQRRVDVVANLSQPLLVLGGDFDWNVPPEETQGWADLLDEVGVEHTALVLPCVTHALNCVTERDAGAITADDIGTHVAPEVLETLVSFLAD